VPISASSTKTRQGNARLDGDASIHNINSDSPYAREGRHYDTAGKLIHKCVTQPSVLGACKPKKLSLEKAHRGGTGQFLVEGQTNRELASP